MIDLLKVGKTFHGKEVLKDINLHIGEGEFVSLIGPSGCGKSTLVSIMAGLDKASDGRVAIGGEEVTGTDPSRMMVFQNAALFPWLTVFQNVAFGLKNMRGDSGSISEKVTRILKKVYLFRYRDYYPHQLSGGMQQRVSIARSMVMNPRILLMDEPFSALDEQTRLLLQNDLQQIWLETSKTIVFVTHNLREAVKLSTRVVILGTKPGTIIGQMNIDLGYPRHADNVDLFVKERILYEKLKLEMEKVVKEELGDEYDMEKGHIPREFDNTLGGGI